MATKKARFSKTAMVGALEHRSAAHAKHHNLDMGNGWNQLRRGANVESNEWWSKVEGYFRARIYHELASDIEHGLFKYPQ